MNLSYPSLALRLALFTCFFSITSTPAASTDGAEPGKKQFNKCVACHSLEPGVHMMGPSLAGLMGREAGSLEGFLYSPAVEESTLVWDQETLSAFLENPQKTIPGNSMPFGGIKKAGQRQALIDYLMSF